MESRKHLFQLALGVLFLMVSSFSAVAQDLFYVNWKFEDYLIGYYGTQLDVNNDGEIQESEAASFTGSINLSNATVGGASEVSDITGIKFFTSITSLTGNLSNSPAFTEIDISGMDNLTEVNIMYGTVDNFYAINCANLKTLRLNTLGIDHLEIFGCTSLTSLDVGFNNLPYLNLKGLTSLNTLNAISNNLISCVEVDNPTYATNNWTITLNNGVELVSNCSGMPIVDIPDNFFKSNLIEYGVDNNPEDGNIQVSEALENTELSIFGNITNLKGLEAFENLTSLSIANLPAFTDIIDLTPFKKLTTISYGNQGMPADLTGLSKLESFNGGGTAIFSGSYPNLQKIRYDTSSDIDLDLSNATNLTNLTEISLSLSIKNLDIANCTNLKTFSISLSEDMAELDLSGLENLETLNIGPYMGSPITYDLINLRGCKSLKDVIVYQQRSEPEVNVINCIEVDDVAIVNVSYTQNGLETNPPFRMTSDCDAEIVNIPDPVIKTDLLKTVDTDHDGEINVNEATNYSEGITVTFNSDYPDTGWLRYFPNVAYFSAGNVMEDLDLSFMKKIDSLNVWGAKVSSNGSTLKNINLNGLSTLAYFGFNSLIYLESIDFRGCSQLKNIISGVSNNGENENNVDFLFSNNSSLENIQLFQTGIGDFDLSQCPNLKNLGLVVCAMNSLDVSSNSYLERLYLQNTPLMSLDISNNSYLNDFNFIISENLHSEDEYLSCITVSDVVNAEASLSTELPASVVFSTNCNLDIPDENFMRYLLNNSDVNTDNNGTVTIEEAEAFSGEFSFSMSDQISDFTGIQYFTGLTSFTISNTQTNYSSIDLSGMPNLTNIDITHAGVTLFDVSNCASLDVLHIDRTDIEELVISESNNVSDIYWYSDGLTVLDLSQFSKLKDLFVNSQTIKSIVTGNSSVLETINITGQISSIDLSNYSYIQNVSINAPLNILNLGDPDIDNLSLSLLSNELNCITAADPETAENAFASKYPEIAFSTDCDAIVEIPDNSFKSSLVDDSSINLNADSEIQVHEAQLYEGTITIPADIADATGIQAFTNATGITCSTGSDDVQYELDLSDMAKLQELNVTNDVSTINANGCTSLTTVVAENANLETFDIGTDNTSIQNLSLVNTEVVEVDTHVFLALEVLEIDNSLSSYATLDLSENIALREVILKNTPYTEIDMRGCTDLTSITTSGNVALTCMNVDDVAGAESITEKNDDTYVLSADCSMEQEIYIPDAVFKQFLLDNTSINTRDDGKITYSEAQAYTNNIRISESNITDLTGIEEFVNINDLYIRDVQAPSLDISSMAKLNYLTIMNAAFESITAQNLSLLTEIAATGVESLQDIQLSGNSALTSVVFEDCSALETIHISANVALEDLAISCNEVATVSTCDLSTNTALTSVKITAPSLTSLDLRNIPAENLATLDVAGSENLTCINVSNPTAMTEKYGTTYPSIEFSENCVPSEVLPLTNGDFRTYLLNNKNLNTNKDDVITVEEAQAYEGTLEITGVDIASEEGLQYFINITGLYIEDVFNMTSVDLSLYPKLKNLDVINCSFETILTNTLSDLSNVTIKKCDTLTTLNFADNTALELLAIDSCAVLEGINLAKNKELASLTITHTSLSSLNVSENTALTSLNVSNNKLSELNLSKNSSLEVLKAADNEGLSCILVANETAFKDNTAITVSDYTTVTEECVMQINEISITACDTYTFGDVVLTESGIYRDTLTSSNNLDSIVILNLTIQTSVSTHETKTIYDGETYTFGSMKLRNAGTYEQTFLSSNGCDSIVTLELLVKYRTVLFDLIRVTAFGEYEFGGEVLTVSGNYKDTLKTASGDDSIAILVLTILPCKRIFKDAYIHANESYDFYGKTITEAGIYKEFFPESGKDSIVTLTMHLLPNEEVVNVIDEKACKSFMFQGKELFTSGTYRDTMKTTDGRDSILVLNLTVNQPDIVYLDKIINRGETIEFEGLTISEPGEYSATLTNSIGCDSTVYLNVRVIEKEDKRYEMSATACDDYNFNGKRLVSSGVYYEEFKTDKGFDSTVVLNLIINKGYHNVKEDYIFYGSTYEFEGKLLNKSGTYTENYETESGCDSMETLKLNVIPLKIVYDIDIAEVCSSYQFFEKELTESGIYLDTISNNGIDTIHILKLTVGNPYELTREEFIKPNETFEFGGTTYSEAGIYAHTFQSTEGCDSTVTVTLSVVDESTEIERRSHTACGEYEFNNEILTSSGAYTAKTEGENGNVHIELLDLIINPIYNVTFDAEIKNGESLQFGDEELFAEGTYEETFTTTKGCDSTVILNLTIDKSTPKYQEYAFEACGAYRFGDTYLYEEGTFTDTFKTVYGADSIVKIHLTINHDYEEEVEDYFVKGTEYVFGTQTITEAGTYTERFQAENYCDSIVHLTLHAIENGETITNIEKIICGDYDFFGTILDESGTYRHTLQSSFGTDSIIELELTVVESFHTATDEYLYEGNTYTLGDTVIATTGKYKRLLQSENGCDSVVDLTITTVPKGTIINKLYEHGCGEFYFEGEVLTKSDKYEYWGKTKNGNDSLAVLYLTITPEYHDRITDTIAYGEVYTFGDEEYSKAGEYIISGTTTEGCDSTMVISLVAAGDTIIVEACGQYIFYGEEITESGIYSATIKTQNGTDSIAYIDVTLHESYFTKLDTTIDVGETFIFNGQPVSKSGVVSTTFTTKNGCDSIVTINVSFVSENSDTVIFENACDYYIYNDDTLTVSDNYFYTFVSSKEQDSVVLLVLTINHPIDVLMEDTIVHGSGFVVGDTVITEEGEHMLTISTVGGCDSIVTLKITVTNNPPEFTAKTDVIKKSIFENEPNGTELLVLEASDDDGNELIYSLVGKSSVFNVDPVSGTVFVEDNKKLDYERYRSFAIQVTVSDGLATDTITIEIELKDIDDPLEINEALAEQIHIYPIPVVSEIHIDSEILDGIVYILSASGSKIMKEKLLEHMDINLKDLSKGTYIVKIETEHGYYSKMIIKE